MTTSCFDSVFLIPIDIPDGNYVGKWSGYTLKFEYDGVKVQTNTKEGVRGLNIPVTFDVVCGKMVQKSIYPIEPKITKKDEKKMTMEEMRKRIESLEQRLDDRYTREQLDYNN